MALLDEEQLDRLPTIYTDDEADPWIFYRLVLPDAGQSWYVIQGERQDDDFLLYCLITGAITEFNYVLLSGLENMRGPEGTAVERDLTFTEGRLTDVVPAPDQ